MTRGRSACFATSDHVTSGIRGGIDFCYEHLSCTSRGHSSQEIFSVRSTFMELALSDSSLRALEMASSVVGKGIVRYQTDLRRLGWRDRWDIAFLLDVLEHVPADAEVLLQIKQALKPGGLLFVTTPALKCFWSYNDEIAHHVRRYNKADFSQLAEATGIAYCAPHISCSFSAHC